MKSGMITKKDLQNKYVFWDVDGTLAAYRFNDHVADPEGTENGMSLKEVEEGVFLEREPSLFMQKVVNECNSKHHLHRQLLLNLSDFFCNTPIYILLLKYL